MQRLWGGNELGADNRIMDKTDQFLVLSEHPFPSAVIQQRKPPTQREEKTPPPVPPRDLRTLGCHGKYTTGREAELQREVVREGRCQSTPKWDPVPPLSNVRPRASGSPALSLRFICRTFSVAAIVFSLPHFSLPCS